MTQPAASIHVNATTTSAPRLTFTAVKLRVQAPRRTARRHSASLLCRISCPASRGETSPKAREELALFVTLLALGDVSGAPAVFTTARSVNQCPDRVTFRPLLSILLALFGRGGNRGLGTGAKAMRGSQTCRSVWPLWLRAVSVNPVARGDWLNAARRPFSAAVRVGRCWRLAAVRGGCAT